MILTFEQLRVLIMPPKKAAFASKQRISDGLRMRCEAIQTRPAGSNSEWLPIANLSPSLLKIGRLDNV